MRGWWRRYWWAVLTATALSAFVLAFIGAQGSFLTRLNTSLLLLPIGRSGGTSDLSTPAQIARILAPIVFAYATFRAVFALFSERLQDVRAAFARKHTVVCGLGGQGEALVESTLGSNKVVAIELNPLNPAVRRLRDLGAVVLVGDATAPETIDKAGIHHARHVLATCGHDATNAQVGANVLELVREHGGPHMDVFVHVADPRLYSFLLHHALWAKGSRLEFFNVYERGARALLTEANRAGGDTDGPLLVVGAGQLGLALVSRVAQLRYERTRADPNGERLPVHVVDREASVRLELLTARYSRIGEVCDFRLYELDVESPQFDHLFEREPSLAEVAAAFVCFDNDGLTISSTLNLLNQAEGRFPVVARVTHRSQGLARMLESAQSRYAHPDVFRPLSIADRACRADLVLQGLRGRLARNVHRVYRELGLGGPLDVPWRELSDEGRERNLRHADAIVAQLEAVGYRLGPLIDWGQPAHVLADDEVERMAELEHERWVAERLREDWRPGGVRDDEARIHPDLVPWQELPEDRREINRRLVRHRPQMLARIGVEVYRA